MAIRAVVRVNRRFVRVLVAAALVLATAHPGRASAEGGGPPAQAAKRVLIIHSFGQHFEPFRSAAAAFRTELALQAPDPIDFYEISLETARFAEGDVDAPLADYVRVLAERLPLDLVVPVGSPAVRFCARHRERLFANVPIVAAGTENRYLAALDIASNITGVGFTADPAWFVEDVLRVLPDTRRIGVIFGSSPIERYWLGECRREWVVFEDRVEFDWLEGLPLSELRARVSQMPERSAILFAFLNMDANGVPYEQDAALGALHAVANAPVFGMFQPQVGVGIVGGRLIDSPTNGVAAARIAVRVLGGEPAGAIARVTVPRTAPTYDWRELQRWHIPENRLPPGSVVRFRQPGAWEAWRGRIIGVAAIVVLQTILIAMLLSNRRRLRSARAKLSENEQSVLQLQRELNHAGRVSLLGQFTASLAHELGQPLGAVLRNADAAELFLKRTPPDLDEVRAIVGDIRRDGERAGNVIDRLRTMLKRGAVESQALDWRELVDEVMSIVHAETNARGIVVEIDTPPGLPAVRGDRVHLQQVLINLIANAIDAIESTPAVERRIVVRTRDTGTGSIECTVSDTGPGIAADIVAGVFDPFVTTKSNGMGMGLPISRTIVEAHGGVLSAANDPGRGATFRFTLPVREVREHHG